MNMFSFLVNKLKDKKTWKSKS